MTASLSLRPPTGIKPGSTLGHSSYHGRLLCQPQHRAGASGNKAICGSERCSARSIIRSVASDFAKGTQHTKVNNVESSIGGMRISTASKVDTPVSSGTLSLPSPHLPHTLETLQETSLDVPGKGRLVKNKSVYRQVFVIRSYEVGFDRTASIETITNLFQETSLNHVGMMDFVGDGMGTTHAMIRNRLIWVVTRMHIDMARYPIWGDVVQIDSWVSSSGKNGMRRDFLVRDYSTGLTLGRATSTWAMMNQDTRRLSKMPEEVRTEISPQFVDRSVMNEADDVAFQRIPFLDDSAPLRVDGLVPKLQDLDMNQHVNHVKYIGWVLESVPQPMLMSCELSRLTLEYRRECGSSDTVESLARSDTASASASRSSDSSSLGSKLGDGGGGGGGQGPWGFTHLLRLSGTGAEVLRGHTLWRLKGRCQRHHR